ncbi:MAG: ACT domain-containing protein [Clostridia bacterium]|nr:ACT domain-containing protein [Clostridia bacterium]
MTCKQLSVFIENRKGTLSKVLNVLSKSGVSILSMSLADTTEYGLLRLIVNDPDTGKKELSNAGYSSLVSNVLVVKIPHVAGSLQELLEKVEKEDINIEYMYGLSIENDDAYVVFKPSDAEKTSELFEKDGIVTLTPEDLLKMKL